MTGLRQKLDAYARRLEQAGIQNPEREIDRLVCAVMGVVEGSAVPLLARASEAELARVEQAVGEREKRRPIERILGTATLFGLTLQTFDGVFKPYPETEAFIEHACLLLEKMPGNPRILDLGTGTGCILLAILKAMPHVSGVGVDIDPQVVERAQANARLTGLEARAAFAMSDWGDGITEKFDLVLSNPPRVATENLDLLMPEMRLYDPPLSLDGGMDGIKFYRRSVNKLPELAKPGGYGLFQVGPKYAHNVAQLFHKHGYLNSGVLINYAASPVAVMVENRFQ
ncbi:MAG: HemK family protein methyltransferase [Alphaproteobacteria bacterium]